MKTPEGTINFEAYENANAFLGMTEVTLPSIETLTEEIKGAGIAGAVNAGFLGHIAAMTATLNFRSTTRQTVGLAAPTVHQLDLRAAQQSRDSTGGRLTVTHVKHVLLAQPTKVDPGKLAPAASADASVELAVSYFATYIDGKKVLEVDPLGYKFEVDGVDYLGDVRKALGK